ncbi:peptide chain release factor N(5)-glutamine methyltransferase [Clostridium massiliamazoniense]|uniref:peptide chain release factor N(5)-glutamine methyltransferase n=1 Tax=Clostridium massiliamazoniense TaxID=1347366 RepID=UPI0006D7D77B|nr:peptide chain release factor N(5)-glutamine methyltransferase [Clostridium massiliamazoniense]
MGENYVGGQAVLDGVMMRGKKGKATAVRNEKGNIEIDIERYNITVERPIDKIPVLRGMISLGSTIEAGLESFNYSISNYDENDLENWLKEKLGKNIEKLPKNFMLYLSVFLSIIIFVIFPTLVTSIFKLLKLKNFQLTLIEGIITLTLLIIYLLIIRSNDMVKNLFANHGAEHKTINCYESKEKLTVENVMKFNRLHKRCGTNFLFNVIFINTILSLFIGWKFVSLRIVARILIMSLAIGITYEIIRWIGKSNSLLSNLVAYPGMKLQILTTSEPTIREIEVAIMALKASEGLKVEKRVDELLNEATEILRNNNVETSRLDAQLLLGKVLDKNKLWLITNNDFRVSEDLENEFFDLVKKRSEKMPIKYILGKAEFMGLDFNVKEGVLIPRPDTEILVEEVLKNIDENEELKLCDLCCGSGAIGLSLGTFRKNISVDLVDIDDIPKEVTLSNIKSLNLEGRANFIQSDLFNNLQGKIYDIIVSNPPYIRNEVIETLMDDVKNYEPHLALAGGEDGLVFYRKIIKESKGYLKNDGILAFEIGHDQGEDVKLLMENDNFTSLEIIKDLAGHDRVVIGKLNVDKEKKIML